MSCKCGSHGHLKNCSEGATLCAICGRYLKSKSYRDHSYICLRFNTTSKNPLESLARLINILNRNHS